MGGFLDPGGIQGTKEVFYGEQQHTENVPQDGAYSCVPYPRAFLPWGLRGVPSPLTPLLLVL